MQDRQTLDNRIFARTVARELKDSELRQVSGAWGVTYCFDPQTHDDAYGGCDIP